MKHPVDVHVGKRVRHRRWMVGMTQQQLADKVGIQISYEGGGPGPKQDRGTRMRLVAANTAALVVGSSIRDWRIGRSVRCRIRRVPGNTVAVLSAAVRQSISRTGRSAGVRRRMIKVMAACPGRFSRSTG
mgnify:CR=1 FL=1